MTPVQWIIRPVDQSATAALSETVGISPVTARILAARGLADPVTAAAFLAPRLADLADPFLMAGMEQAIERLTTARIAGEQVCIYGDYDVDGITATALLVSGFAALGLRTGYHIPNRMEDGYGLNREALQQIRDRGYSLAVSVDCGVTAVDEAHFCRTIGLDLIITDHHLPLDQLPDAQAVVNPNRSDCRYPFKGLAGVGVAFGLLVALRCRLRELGIFAGDNGPDLRKWLDLVALGTIADMVPLLDQNRLLVQAGLRRMAQGERPGLTALQQASGMKGVVSCGQVGFQLAPRLNAAGRLESAVPGVELLLTDDPQRAAVLAAELDGANAERRRLEQQIFDQAVDQLEQSGWSGERRSIVLWSPEWHQGVVGIVASRLVERYHRPTVLIALREDGSGKGSGRGIPGLHLLQALQDCAGHLQRFGGHRAAAGVTVPADRLDAFAAAFELAAARQLAGIELRPELMIDSEVTASDLHPELARELQQLAPFGIANPEPVLLLRNLQVLDSRTFGDQHLKCRVVENGSAPLQAVGWRMAGCHPLPARVDLACCVELNCWNNEERLQLRLKAVRPAGGADHAA